MPITFILENNLSFYYANGKLKTATKFPLFPYFAGRSEPSQVQLIAEAILPIFLFSLKKGHLSYNKLSEFTKTNYENLKTHYQLPIKELLCVLECIPNIKGGALAQLSTIEFRIAELELDFSRTSLRETLESMATTANSNENSKEAFFFQDLLFTMKLISQGRKISPRIGRFNKEKTPKVPASLAANIILNFLKNTNSI